jgi:hypothetical protein
MLVCVLIRVKVKGSTSDVVQAFTALGSNAVERGVKVFVEDPTALATSGGNIEIELPNIEDERDGRAVVRSIIDRTASSLNSGVYRERSLAMTSPHFS